MRLSYLAIFDYEYRSSFEIRKIAILELLRFSQILKSADLTIVK